MKGEPSPLVRWEDAVFESRDIAVWIKRDDLIDPWTGGNKGRKMAAWWSLWDEGSFDGIYSFGGAFSNHLTAVAAAAYRRGIPCVGIVRGHPVDNPVIRLWQEWGMEVRFAGVAGYHEAKMDPPIDLNSWLGIPEGGAHERSLAGCREIVRELRSQHGNEPLHIAVAAGTGTTACGIIAELSHGDTVWVFPAVRVPYPEQWFSEVMERYHIMAQCGIYVDRMSAGKGFARRDDTLADWIVTSEAATGIRWDPVYTGKMAIRIAAMCREGIFPAGMQLIIVHSGGMAGRIGYAWRYDGRIIKEEF